MKRMTLKEAKKTLLQIPVKPKLVDGYEHIRATECPICGQEFGLNVGIQYCDNCGQKLDWSDWSDQMEAIKNDL